MDVSTWADVVLEGLRGCLVGSDHIGSFPRGPSRGTSTTSLTSVQDDISSVLVLEHFWPGSLQIELRWKWLFVDEMPALLQLVESNLAAEAAVWSGSSIAALPGGRVVGFHQTGYGTERGTCGSHDGYQHIVVVNTV